MALSRPWLRPLQLCSSKSAAAARLMCLKRSLPRWIPPYHRLTITKTSCTCAESLGLKAVALPLLGLGELEEFRQLGARAILTQMLLHETVPPRHHLRCPRFERHAHHETCRRRCCAWPQRSSALLRASATPRVEIKERAAMSCMSSPTQFTWLWLDTLAAKAWKVDLRS